MLEINDFQEQILHMSPDYEGEVIATLIRSPHHEEGRPAVLYLHGFNDYFFQTHVAERFHENGYNFYALDLRKYGRSLLPHQHPNYCRSLTEYFEEIDQSLQILNAEHNTGIHLLGHSTGGLVASLYMNKGTHKDLVNSLLLNSPFLQFNLPKWKRLILYPFSAIISFLFPYASQDKALSHLYGKSIHRDKNGEWGFNTQWKPLNGFPAYYKWVYAVARVQAKLKKASRIQVPVLILHAAKSSLPTDWNEELMRSDMVLNVKHIKKYGPQLGPQVELTAIEDAMHDVFLSGEPVREKAFTSMFDWLKKVAAHSLG